LANQNVNEEVSQIMADKKAKGGKVGKMFPLESKGAKGKITGSKKGK
jgi:hypothetical protein